MDRRGQCQSEGLLTAATALSIALSQGKTAEELFIHRNSLQYRLNKIQELVDFELDDYMEYLDVVNCILIKRLMFS